MAREWWEKEEAFERAYNSGRCAKSLWDYIPDKLLVEDAVADTEVDQDGYWIYLNEGWRAYDGGEDCGIIHEYTVADIRAAVKTIGRAR